jgi:predicted MPP superfamily phosphohydrolase
MRTDRRFRLTTLLAIFLLAYAGMQFYAVYKAYAGFGLTPDAMTGLVVWVALMTSMPFLLWWLERRSWHWPVVIGAWIAYTWMGLVFIFSWFALALDVFGFSVNTAGALLRVELSAYAPSARHVFQWAAALSLGLGGYGLIDARRRRVEHIVLSTPKLSAGSHVLRIVQISDVHLGVLIGARRLERILERVRALEPDVLVSTGDLLDGQANHLNGLTSLFQTIQPRFGKFAVTGNHEFLVGHERALDFMRRCGFTVLCGESAALARNVTIAGVDDPASQWFGVAAHLDEPALLAAQPPEHFVVLLKHQPVVDPRASGHFDLQLSGHVHQGQIFPFGLLVRLAYPVRSGLTELAPHRWLYVSRGTGTWGPPMRVLAPPEITLIEIRPAPS